MSRSTTFRLGLSRSVFTSAAQPRRWGPVRRRFDGPGWGESASGHFRIRRGVHITGHCDAGASVLVVDDEQALTDTTVQILERQGYRACGAYTAEEAIRYFRDLRPKLVLMDILLPDGSGVDAALEMLVHRPGLRIVLMSGQAEVTDLLAKARAQGQDLQVFPKPIAPPALLDLVGSILSGA
jgi:CheY-like chemotaxis protein